METANKRFQVKHFNKLYSEENFRPFYYFIRKETAVLVYKFAKFIPGNSRILDVGCGIGAVESYLQFLPIDSREIISIDISEVAINRAKNLVRDKRFNFIKMAFEDIKKLGKFNMIFAFEFIEHVVDPYKFIRIIYETLKGNGYFILSTPNRLRLENRILKFFHKKEVMVDTSHEREYTFLELEPMLENAGFELVYRATQGLWGGWVVYYLFPFLPDRWKKVLALKSFFRGESKINYWVGKLFIFRNFANYIYIVAKKKVPKQF